MGQIFIFPLLSLRDKPPKWLGLRSDFNIAEVKRLGP